MTTDQIARLRYLTEILENVDTDIFIYGADDCNEREFLKVDRENAEKELMDYMQEIVK